MIFCVQRLLGRILLVSVPLLGTSCERIREPVYHGKALSYWAMETQDQDFDFSPSADALEAAKAIHAIGARAAVPWLVRWIKPPIRNSVLPGGAVESFRILGVEAKAAIPDLSTLLRRKPATLNERSSWRSAADAISYLGPDSIDVMIGLADSVTDGKEQLIGNLGNMGTNGNLAIPRLVGWTKDLEPTIREAAISALGKIGLQPGTVVPVLRNALRDPDPRVRNMAVESLAAFGREASSAIPDLAAILISPSAGSEDPEKVTETLSYLGPDAIPVIIRFGETTQRQNEKLIVSLGNMGTNGTKAMSQLLVWTHDPNPAVRSAAASALGGIALRPDAVVPVLRNLLDDPEPSVKCAAAGALAGFGPDARSAVQDLMRILDTLEPRKQATAIEALGQIGRTGEERNIVLPRLIEKLHFHPATMIVGEGLVRGAAASALGDLGGAGGT
jgi:hypothetical protein